MRCSSQRDLGFELSNTYVSLCKRTSCRCSVTVSGDDPQFVNRLIDQDVTLKVLPRTTLTVGARCSWYFGGIESLADRSG